MIVIVAGIAGCATSPVVLRSTGAGAVAFGASLAETELMVGSKGAGSNSDAACRYVEFSSLPGLRFTVENGVVTRADAGPGVRNELGVQLGDTTESVLSLYPDLSMRKNRESAGGTDLILIDPDGGHAIVMQAAGNKIISIRAGLSASVGSVQGCP
jgi:uncharacterized protein (AIM24 family)